MKRPDDRESKGRHDTPVETRFKPGQSGNPRGRPKKGNSVASMIQDGLMFEVAVAVGGKTEKMSAVQVALRRALQGGEPQDLQFIAAVLKLRSASDAEAAAASTAAPAGHLIVSEAPKTKEEWEARYSYKAGAPGPDGKTWHQTLAEKG
jgi:hypothetical protein